MLVIAIIFWLAASVLAMAFIEYVVHRWPMHNGRFVKKAGVAGDLFEAHAVLHHGRYYRESFVNDPDPASRRISIRMSAVEHLAGAMLVCVPLYLWVSVTAAICFAAVVVFHATVWTAFHVEMHMPKGRWFSKLWVYKYVRDCHHAHHLHPGTNFAAVFPPLMDLLFGTYHPPVPVPCEIPPAGWKCTRGAGHDGPCAAVPK